jgi:hypothetical protein
MQKKIIFLIRNKNDKQKQTIENICILWFLATRKTKFILKLFHIIDTSLFMDLKYSKGRHHYYAFIYAETRLIASFYFIKPVNKLYTNLNIIIFCGEF